VRRNPPRRSYAALNTQIEPLLLEKIKHDTRVRGYKTQRLYLEALIANGLPDDVGGRRGQFLSAAPALLPTLLGHRTVRALEALSDRIDAGEEVGTLEADLREIRKDVAAALSELHVAYEREVDARDERVLSGDL